MPPVSLIDRQCLGARDRAAKIVRTTQRCEVVGTVGNIGAASRRIEQVAVAPIC